MSLTPTWIPAAVLTATAVLWVGFAVAREGRGGWIAIFDFENLSVLIAILVVLADFLFFGYIPFWGE